MSNATAAKRGIGLGPWVASIAIMVAIMVWLANYGTEIFRKYDNMQTTESGLMYEVLNDADGEKPIATDTVLVHYEGKLQDGTVFDSSYARGEPVPFPLDAVVPGFSEGIQLMPKGSKFHFVFPPHLGYGAQGAGGVIPPNATLDFVVELLDIAPREAAAPAEAVETFDSAAGAQPAE